VTDHVNPIIDKIRKLLALGSSPNEHEASLAMQKAAELMERHSIEMATVESRPSDDAFVDQQASHSWKPRAPQPVFMLGFQDILRSYFFVEILITSREGQKQLILFGRRHHVAIAMHALDYLLQAAEGNFSRRWGQGEWTLSKKATSRRSYFAGFAAGVKYSMAVQERARRHQRAASVNALITRESAIRQEAMYSRFLITGTARCSRHQIDSSAFSLGKNDGEKVSIPAGISSSPPTAPNLLTQGSQSS
jgi:hypothetical protein